MYDRPLAMKTGQPKPQMLPPTQETGGIRPPMPPPQYGGGPTPPGGPRPPMMPPQYGGGPTGPGALGGGPAPIRFGTVGNMNDLPPRMSGGGPTFGGGPTRDFPPRFTRPPIRRPPQNTPGGGPTPPGLAPGNHPGYGSNMPPLGPPQFTMPPPVQGGPAPGKPPYDTGLPDEMRRRLQGQVIRNLA